MTSSTYTNSFLLNEFCDRFITTEKSYVCSKCNLTIFSQHCYKGHKRLCYGKGHFGWKCTKCNKFFYRYCDETSNLIKKKNDCSMPKKCRSCYEPKVIDHICAMKKPDYSKTWPSLAFLSLEFLYDKSKDMVPFLLIVYLECKNNHSFKKFTYSIVPQLNSACSNDESFFPYYPEYVYYLDNIKAGKR